VCGLRESLDDSEARKERAAFIPFATEQIERRVEGRFNAMTPIDDDYDGPAEG
jgi:hypothetical protein